MPRYTILVLALLQACIANNATLAAWTVDGVPLCTAPSIQQFPTIASDGQGGAIVAWYDFRPPGDCDIFAQRISASGNPLWAVNGIAVCDANNQQNFPCIVTDGTGGALIAWHDRRRGVNSIDLYAQHVDAHGNALWIENGIPIALDVSIGDPPLMISDTAGGAFVVGRKFQSGTGYDIFAQHIGGGGDIWWSPSGVLVCAAPFHQRLADLALDGAGGIVTTWEDWRNESNFDVYAARLDESGMALWPPDGALICDAVGDQRYPKIVADLAGGALVVWQDARNLTNTDIYLNHVNDTGVIWSSSGMPLCVAAGYQDPPVVVADGTGGAFVTWQDLRDGSLDPNIYAARVRASGDELWTNGGVVVCNATETQGRPIIVPDSNGGAIVAWSDSRDGNVAIYADRLDAVGESQWSSNGIPVCTAEESNWPNTLVSDQSDGAIIVWERVLPLDGSSIESDIYAQRLSASGSIPTGIAEQQARTLDTRVFPNPFSTDVNVDVTMIKASHVEIDVFDVSGKRVRPIHANRFPSGVSSVVFDGRDDNGRLLPSGVYFLRVRAAGETVTRKLVIAR